MNVCLICPPFYFRRHIYYLSQNLGIGYIAGVLERAGHVVTIIDSLAEGFDRRQEVKHNYETVFRYGLPYDEIVNRIPDNTQIIGLTAPFTNHALIIKELSQKIKGKFKDTPIVVGGIYPSVLKEKALTNHVDFLVIGEGEEAMLKLANGEDPKGIKGLIFRESGKLIDTGQAEALTNLDSIPFPARHLMPIEKYFFKEPAPKARKKVSVDDNFKGLSFQMQLLRCSQHLRVQVA